MNKYIPKIFETIDFIEENMTDEVNISTLAKQVGVSPWHFQRLFKSLVGDSLGGYLRGRRLAMALELLQTSNLRIIDIAVHVGFNSHEAFTRSFKQKFNVGSKDYREINPIVSQLKNLF